MYLIEAIADILEHSSSDAVYDAFKETSFKKGFDQSNDSPVQTLYRNIVELSDAVITGENLKEYFQLLSTVTGTYDMINREFVLRD